MRSQAPPRRKSSAGIIFLILFLFAMFAFGLLLLACVGAFIFARAEAQRSHAVARREMARAEAEERRAEIESFRDQVEVQRQQAISDARSAFKASAEKAEEEPIRVAQRELTLLLDADGNIEADGKAVEKDQLKKFLRDANKGRETALTVTIKADRQCLFDHVAKVLSVCQELDVANVRVATRD
jgi:biopolymer transport protein ExbD